jgi:large subunit ribosomal protein L35Ae
MTQGIIVNFRRGRKTYTPRHYIIMVEGVNDKKKAASLIGKSVSWKTSSGKILTGKIAATHGSKGVVRAIFEIGLPGQAIGTKVEIK